MMTWWGRHLVMITKGMQKIVGGKKVDWTKRRFSFGCAVCVGL